MVIATFTKYSMHELHHMYFANPDLKQEHQTQLHTSICVVVSFICFLLVFLVAKSDGRNLQRKLGDINNPNCQKFETHPHKRTQTLPSSLSVQA